MMITSRPRIVTSFSSDSPRPIMKNMKEEEKQKVKNRFGVPQSSLTPSQFFYGTFKTSIFLFIKPFEC